jgi:hypothetical protein
VDSWVVLPSQAVNRRIVGWPTVDAEDENATAGAS